MSALCQTLLFEICQKILKHNSTIPYCVFFTCFHIWY